jgi:DNA-binding NarL/FixJ family response regulator
MESGKRMLVAIVAQPGIMRNSLLSYLRAIPDIQDVLVADDARGALRIAREQKPSLVIVDSDLAEEEMLNLVQRVAAEFPEMKIVALVESLRQKQRSLNIGASHALLKGFLDEQLRKVILDGPEENETYANPTRSNT